MFLYECHQQHTSHNSFKKNHFRVKQEYHVMKALTCDRAEQGGGGGV